MTRLPGVTWVLLVLLAAGIVLPLVGLRSPATHQSQAAQTPIVPGSEGMIASLRGAPTRAISNPRRAVVVSGIAFGRTENIDPADSQMFRDSGLWHLLTRGQVARTRSTESGSWTPRSGRPPSDHPAPPKHPITTHTGHHHEPQPASVRHRS